MPTVASAATEIGLAPDAYTIIRKGSNIALEDKQADLIARVSDDAAQSVLSETGMWHSGRWQNKTSPRTRMSAWHVSLWEMRPSARPELQHHLATLDGSQSPGTHSKSTENSARDCVSAD